MKSAVGFIEHCEQSVTALLETLTVALDLFCSVKRHSTVLYIRSIVFNTASFLSLCMGNNLVHLDLCRSLVHMHF